MHGIATSFVAYPTVVTGVYVRDAGMAFSFRRYMVLIGMFLRPGGLRMLLRRCMRRRGPVSGNVSTADVRRMAVRLPILSEGSHTRQYE
jgi:hypothetical protein